MTVYLYGIRLPQWLARRLVVEAEILDLTQPGDTFAVCRATGRQRVVLGRLPLTRWVERPVWSIV